MVLLKVFHSISKGFSYQRRRNIVWRYKAWPISRANVSFQVFPFMPLSILLIWKWFNLPTKKWNTSTMTWVRCLCLSGPGGKHTVIGLDHALHSCRLRHNWVWHSKVKMAKRENLCLPPPILHIYTKVWLIPIETNPNHSEQSAHNKGQKKNTHMLEKAIGLTRKKQTKEE